MSFRLKTVQIWTLMTLPSCVPAVLENKEKKFSNHTAFRCYYCLRGTHGSRGIAETAYLFWFPRGARKCNLVTRTSYIALLSTASARAEGSKKPKDISFVAPDLGDIMKSLLTSIEG